MRKSRLSCLPAGFLLFTFLAFVFFSYPASAGAARRVTQIAELTDSHGDRSSFGFSISLSGNTIAVGAPYGDLAYVFVKPASGWMNMNQTAALSSTGFVVDFGHCIATNGDTVVVGAPTDTDELPSLADVFVEGASGWQDINPTADLGPSNRINDFGWTCAIAPSGNAVLVSEPFGTPQGFDGAVWAFKKPAGGWESERQFGIIFPPPGANAALFGWSIAIDGNTLVIGDYGANGYSGAVFVYELVGGHLTEVAELTPSDGEEDTLGVSVAISGNTIVAGAAGRSGVGAAYVFVKPPTGWANMTETAQLTSTNANPQAGIGSSVAIDGKVIVAGAPYANVGSNIGQGAILGFLKPASGWTNATENFVLLASDGAAGDNMGSSIAAGGGVVASGAPEKDNGVGAVYVFTHP